MVDTVVVSPFRVAVMTIGSPTANGGALAPSTSWMT